ncbi:MAG: peptidyl-prolyl cis-trans isomerase [Acidobacteria bacterium]|nr:peptidyl-prolyl cis-trans isomerase [Acidobacteriota bacterium]
MRFSVQLLSAIVLVLAGTLTATALAQKKPDNPAVVIQTSMGDITVELFKDKAPKSVENFLAYAQSGFYDGTIFHRVIKGFMIQGGGFTPDMTRKPTRPPIPNEANNGRRNVRGTIAMARTPDINSATSQFFINTVDNAGLDHRGDTPDKYGYAVFGKVTKGMNVVDQIESTATGNKGPYQNVPLRTVLIKSVKVVQ